MHHCITTKLPIQNIVPKLITLLQFILTQIVISIHLSLFNALKYDKKLSSMISGSENINILSRKGVNGLIIVINQGEQNILWDLIS